MTKKAKVLTTEYLVIVTDMLEKEYWCFPDEDELEAFFRGACKDMLDRDDEETDAQGRTIDDMWLDREADFGDMGMEVKLVNRYAE